MLKGSTLLLALLLMLPPAWAENWPGAQWSKGPAASGPALEALEAYAFAPRNEATRLGIRSDALLVIRDGQLIYERYAGPTNADTPHLTWSISKSLLAAVLGVAYGEGRFQLQDKAARFLPALRQHPDIRMADLLHWASGLDWQEDYEYAPLKSSVVAMLYTRGHGDMASFTAEHPAFSPPGQVFRYSSGDSNLLSAALKGMLGAQRYADYPWQALFEPLGITHAVWESDATGTFVGSSYAYLTARDLARVGLLMLRDGRWGERQLLPRDWVEFNRTPFAGYQANQDELVPGGHWWLNRAVGGAPSPWPDAPADTFAALGHWGQALYVIPSAGLVIVRYADDRDDSYSHNALLKLALAAFARQVQP
ncbi:serine hydrolase domain-containing protein [Pseudomonas chlororaphis]|uniref:serine hydrolase domain-containing protein n=1 Tax=Pseudomonas chlororaphis TaxID=587753 RepID=UPI0023654CDE|nr:serine hydrolase [Pseudomonas chlororaphis]WDG54885.1 serine hydrolase [Pseudomonas chlororaphis]WDH89913.1 serine hydrolase [Pseudomonas chlororaphis]